MQPIKKQQIIKSALVLVLAALAMRTASGQALSLPVSGASLEQAGQVSAGQMTLPLGPSVVQPSLMVMGAYAGGVTKDAAHEPLRLTMAEAIRRGMESNLGVITSESVSATVRAQRVQALSYMLPQVNGTVGETVMQSNLAAYGFTGLMPGINPIVGPFQYVQAQANVSWNGLSLTSLRNVQAASAMQKAVLLNAQDARELVTLAVGGTYWQLVSSAARIEAERRQVESAQAIFHRTQEQLSAGTTTRVDMTRSQVQLQAEQERLISLEGSYQQQKIAFARMIGVAQDRELILSEPLEAQSSAAVDESAALLEAAQRRLDLQSSAAQVKAAERAVEAARGERLPSISFNGYYGANGTHPSQSHGVFVAQGAINFPIFDGGRIRGDVRQAQAALRQRQAELNDRKARVEQEVRTALIQLHTAEGQVKLAESNRQLAQETLEQSRDRFEAGVTTTVEVVQAQQQAAGAENDFISSLFALNLARLNLARATGSAEAQFGK